MATSQLEPRLVYRMLAEARSKRKPDQIVARSTVDRSLRQIEGVFQSLVLFRGVRAAISEVDLVLCAEQVVCAERKVCFTRWRYHRSNKGLRKQRGRVQNRGVHHSVSFFFRPTQIKEVAPAIALYRSAERSTVVS